METIEPFLIELDFDGTATQSSNITLNQGNRNNVILQFKIFKGAKEINYTDYDIAEVAFEKRNGALVVETATISSNGIFYTLHEKVIDTVGNVKGQIMLSKDNITSVTLHYDFKVIADLSSIARVGTFYVGVIEKLLSELKILTDNSKMIITQITSDSINSINKTHSDFLDELQRLIDLQNLILQDINDGNFVTYAYLHNYTVDGGYFLDGQNPVAIHNSTPVTHTNMLVDGGTMEIVDGRIMTLEEHVIDQTAHQNLIIDGNNV